MRTCVIVNPVAGSAQDVPALAGLLGKLPGVRVLLTTSGEDAEVLAREAVEAGFRRIVAAGGDGTVNAVLNGAEGAGGGGGALGEIEFGILPLGTGNDMAASLGMRVPIPEAVELLARWQVRPVDLVRVRCLGGVSSGGMGSGGGGGVERLMFNGSAGGFVQTVGAATEQESKRGILGSLSYILTAVVSVTEMTPYRVKLRIDGAEQVARAIATIVSNGRTLGGSVPVNPDGYIDDGLLEVLVIPEMPLAELALLGVSIVNGRHVGAGGARGRGSGVGNGAACLLARGRSIEITSEPPMPVNVDGEAIGTTPLTYEVLPGALRAVIGREPALAPPAGGGAERMERAAGA